MRAHRSRKPLACACLLAACLGAAVATASCGESAPGPQGTARMGTTTTIGSAPVTTARPVDSSTEVSSVSSSSTTITAAPSPTAGVAGWRLDELGVPADSAATGRLAFDDDRIAWIATENDRVDVFTMDLGSRAKTRLTDTREEEAAIALDGPHVAWVARDPDDVDGSAALELYDLETGQTATVAEGPIAPGCMVQVAGDHVAWCQTYTEHDEGETVVRLALFVYTISSGQTIKLSDRLVTGSWEPSGKTGFDLDVGHIAFIETAMINSDAEVWLYDLNTRSKTHLSHEVASSHHVSLRGDLVTFAIAAKTPQGAPYPAADILVTSIKDQYTKKVATAFTPEPIPQTDGRYVVWDTYVGDASFNVRVIQGYDAKKDRQFDVSQNAYLNARPEISDGVVVWERGGEPDTEIIARDLSTGQITQLSDDPSMDQMPRVQGRTVIWCTSPDPASPPSASDPCRLAKAPARFRDSFSDVAGTYRYRTAIQAMYEWGVAPGFKVASDVQYHPEEGLGPAEFTQMADRALQVSTAVSSGTGSVDTAGNEQLLLTRAQAVSLLVEAVDRRFPGMLEGGAEPPGAVAWEGPYRDSLERAYANHLLSSLIDWMQPWDASKPCSRGEAAQMIYNAVRRASEEVQTK